MYPLKSSNNTASNYQIECQVDHPCFNFLPTEKITVVTGLEPRPGELVLVEFNGKRRFGRYQITGIELSDGTIAPLPFVELVGVIALDD